MPAETVEAKARRLLVAGRLLVEHVDDDVAVGLCAGDHGMYEVWVELRGPGRRCSCAAAGRCTHVLALELVTGRWL